MSTASSEGGTTPPGTREDLALARDGTIFGTGGTEIDFRTPDYSVWLTIKAKNDRDAEKVAAAIEAKFGTEGGTTRQGTAKAEMVGSDGGGAPPRPEVGADIALLGMLVNGDEVPVKYGDALARVDAELERLDSGLDEAIGVVEENERELARLRDGLRRIAENAEAWHGNEGIGTGHARALKVIRDEARALLSASQDTKGPLDADVAQNAVFRTGSGDIESGGQPFTDSGLGRGGSEPPSASSGHRASRGGDQ